MSPKDAGHAPHEDSYKGGDIRTEIMDLNIVQQDKLNIAHDLLLDYSSGDRNKILSRLQRIQRQQEIKFSDDSTFRPAFVSLYGEDQVEDRLGINDFEQAKSDLPAFVSIPTIHSDEPFSRLFDETLQPAKSLLQYHYRLGTLNDTFERSDSYFAPILDDMRAPCVREMWCLALDNKNLITASWLPANNIWPMLSPGAQHSDQITATLRVTLPDGRSKKRETLQDLENDLEIAIKKLKGHYGTAHSELKASRNNENKDMLRSIQPFQDNLSLACLLRMCTITTPTRFSITSQDIMDMFSVKISRLEWLVRDSASQPQVYQISAISDELQILKEILHSQMQVVSQVSQSLAQAMVSPMSVKAGKGKTPETEQAHASLGTRKDDSENDQQTKLFNLLQRKSQLRHRKLAYDIERLQDTAERLKSQAALFIKIKAEDQSVAIYVFTLVTVVFLPLSFATSYMGMNTSDIRDMEQGQWIFWAVGGTLTVVVLLGVWTIAYRGPRWKKARQTQKLLHMD
ncbi:Mg2+ transporter like zinc transport [Fusarium pseudocircinatum]|uniref:Mg2+ transporter like zinc transport n=1 Tax=Fusarium pseudocircinatum TaxID=56676 RepID=A0A8H5NVX8_9HYPO|nr:Mg2+ transporter like zinc transport [Fusarium pseudocircinatum]